MTSRRVTSADRAKPAIARLLNLMPRKAFSLPDLTHLLSENRSAWDLPMRFTREQFIALLETMGMTKVSITSQIVQPLNRYLWTGASEFDVALSLRQGSYLCHASAVFLHGLTDQRPKTLYINYEQSPKPSPEGDLSQDAIARAFSHQQRASKLAFVYADSRIVVLSGKNTGRLEVGTLTQANGSRLDVTKIERTLIDIVVRPGYAGGPFQVLEAFRNARGRISASVLRATLLKLDYVYPYHQAIGFYLERAGFDEKQVGAFREMERRFDFYLAHGLHDTEYVTSWRIFVPRGL